MDFFEDDRALIEQDREIDFDSEIPVLLRPRLRPPPKYKRIREEARAIMIPQGGLRISVGCGRHVKPGWFCIDAVQHPKAERPLDMISDVKKIDLPNECASEVLAVHVWEHLYRWECDDTIEEWKRLLRPDGLLVLEMPDLIKACRNVLEGRAGPKHPDQFGMWALYGDPAHKDPLMIHRWAWTFKTLRAFLIEHGFNKIENRPTQWHLVGHMERDFRIEARKS